jgi:hypothetical protein
VLKRVAIGVVIAAGALFAALAYRRSSAVEDAHRQALERARADVQKFGWHLVEVYDDEGSNGFLYTIGLWKTYRHPEIIAFSPTAEPTVFAEVFAALGKRIAAGERFEAGQTYPKLIGAFGGTFRAVEKRWYPDYLGLGEDFYDNLDFPAEELIWPDKAGRFPWEPDFNRRIRDLQPLLFRK